MTVPLTLHLQTTHQHVSRQRSVASAHLHDFQRLSLKAQVVPGGARGRACALEWRPSKPPAAWVARCHAMPSHHSPRRHKGFSCVRAIRQTSEPSRLQVTQQTLSVLYPVHCCCPAQPRIRAHPTAPKNAARPRRAPSHAPPVLHDMAGDASAVRGAEQLGGRQEGGLRAAQYDTVRHGTTRYDTAQACYLVLSNPYDPAASRRTRYGNSVHSHWA